MTYKLPVKLGEKGLEIADMDGLYRLSKAVAAAPDMRPKSMDTPEKIMVAMVYGSEIGLAPMQAINSIAVVNGKPSVYGETLIAVANASGLINDVKERFTGEGEKLTAICTITRTDGRVTTGEFSVEDAKKANLWGRSGPWSSYPKRMLMWRARGFAYRDGVPEALRGLWFREEVEDIRSMRDVTPQEPPTTVDPILGLPQEKLSQDTNHAEKVTLDAKDMKESTGTHDEPASADTPPEDSPGGATLFSPESTAEVDPPGSISYEVEWVKGSTKLSLWVAAVEQVLDEAVDPFEAWQENLDTFTALMGKAKDEKSQGALQALQDHAEAKIKAIEQDDLLSAG